MLYYFQKFVNNLQGKTTKIYLILANIILVIFAIWFSNVELLPFSNLGDFLFFVILGLLFAIYRPGWAFVFFIGSIVLENINLAPQNLGLVIRPYQLLGALIIIALIIRTGMKRLPLPASEFFPKFKWYDALPIVFALGGFLSSIGATNKTMGLKQSIVALSFVALYFLVRIYIQSFSDLKRIAPFFLSSAIVVTLYGILQNIIFIHGGNSFEVMPGRPNATFTEPDWYGIYLVLVLSVVYTMIYYFKSKPINFSFLISNDQFPISNKFSITNDQIKKYIVHTTLYILLALVIISLILTVSRSAWIGAIFVMLVFLKSTLLQKYANFSMEAQSKWQNLIDMLKFRNFDWKGFFRMLRNIAITVIVSIGVVYLFGLTRFQLGNRAASTGGLQKITIACASTEVSIPNNIVNIDELAQYGCKHINLEDIEKEKLAGNVIAEVQRPDPNINIRGKIYQTSWQQIKQHPILGIGWGSISKILGTDERGAGLNASDIFLEVWLGAGLIGFLSFVFLLGYIIIASILAFISNNDRNRNGIAIVFVMLGSAAIVISNLFNSGIFLGFVWVYMAIAISLLTKKE